MQITFTRLCLVGSFLALLPLALIAPAPQTQPEDYPHGEFGGDCSLCHGPEGWSPAQIDPELNHGTLAGFELTGSHRKAPCRSCHLSLEFKDAKTDCASCHQDIHNGEFGPECSDCHTTTNFIDRAQERRNHMSTRFPLIGAHNSVDCASCHESQNQGGMRFVNTPTDCVACHRKDFLATTDPNHVALGFNEDCSRCHTPMAWETARFDHDATNFPLSGAHAGLTCENCHSSGQLGGQSAQCVSCHDVDYASTTNPDHAAAGFPTDCQQCHSTASWAGAAFNHALTGFPLTGGHAMPLCNDCHTSGVYGPIPNTCIDCHQADYDQVPIHAAGGFPSTCEDCHSINAWTGATFNHATFPITGAHVPLTCQQCHTSGTFGPMPSECIDCHQADYDQAPSHITSGFPTTCDSCHSNNAWTGATFDHATFPITGAHVALSCQQCHTSGTFEPMPSNCINCHQVDYVGAPSHTASNFSQNCVSCHTTQTWTNATFDHGFFPLTGAHNAVDCIACHTTGVYQTIPNNCIDCHQSDYNQAPSHVTSGFPTTCDSCHSNTTWLGATFDHATFPITGAHVPLSCEQCHTSGTNGPIPSECVDCHLTDFTTAPGHVGTFPQTCETCHTTTTFVGGTFDHSFFPTTGGHLGVLCVDCHTSGDYGSIPSACISCHQADYQAAPDHAFLNFPTDCEQCHAVTIWQNNTFVHSFPISGPHDRTCTECHITGTTNEFSCEGTCHKHTQSKMEEKHRNENGYVYDFQACLSCHPNGRH